MTALVAETTDVLHHYDRDGVVLVRGLIGTDEIATVRDTFTAQVEHDDSMNYDDGVAAGDILGRYPRFVHPHRHPDTAAGRVARALMSDRRILDVVTRLLGPVYGAQSMFYFKPPTARGQALHQDNLFLQAHPETCLAAWIAVDDCDGENGALTVIPGSHRIQLLCPEEADRSESFADLTVPVPEDVERVQTTMRAGDVLFFHGSLVHGSKPNTSADRFRRSLIFHYIPQRSAEVAKFYQPLVDLSADPTDADTWITESPDGGPCGEGWAAGEPQVH